MKRVIAASALAAVTMAGGMSPADAKTAAQVSAPHQATQGQRYLVTARGGTDAAGHQVRLCVAKVGSAHGHQVLYPQSCSIVGMGSATAHVVERRPGRMTYVGVVYSRKDGHVESVSSPVTVRVR